uniref:Uncharacterized protein n=1 Tax=Nelumbo nucifera TaxID=4432 RepID=A0A822YS25_NELNU|nr:TPA_asm: hypothetical protein HUJ06_005967 [Nelumbo nucifera]
MDLNSSLVRWWLVGRFQDMIESTKVQLFGVKFSLKGEKNTGTQILVCFYFKLYFVLFVCSAYKVKLKQSKN